MSDWPAGSFQLAWSRNGFDYSPVNTDGFTRGGLGLHLLNDTWRVTHLGSGHMLLDLKVRFFNAAVKLADEIVDLGDWTFDGLDGWQNRDPELKAKFIAWLDERELMPRRHPTKPEERSEQCARQIAMSRDV